MEEEGLFFLLDVGGEGEGSTSARWKVLFSDKFSKTFQELTPDCKKKVVLNHLLKVASGWRPKKKVESVLGSSSQILKKFKIEGLYIVCTIDIVKELCQYTQVLKVWDILPLEDIPKLEKRLDGIFGKYTDDFINHCKEKCLEGDLEVPKTWSTSSEIVQLKDLSSNENGNDLSGAASDGRSYMETSKVSDYALSSGAVSHLLPDHDGRELDFPIELTDQELEIIIFPRSTFVLGSSGTARTTVLTMKLLKKEDLHHKAMEGCYGVKSNSLECGSHKDEVGEAIRKRKGAVWRKLFVTVSPKRCYAVKQHISELKSCTSGEKFSTESNSNYIDSIDDTVQFKGIPDSFVDISRKSYPLVITFHKFLMMLDGTLGNSYFERFQDARKLSDGQIHPVRSVALQTFIRTKEVNYERFSSTYWPHFDTQLTKKVDSSRVFMEIMSHIKGSLQATEASDGKLSREDYVQSSETWVSSLSKHKRKKIYDIFQNYERMKMENGEFDLADVVIDLHRRLRDGKYGGDEMDFVFIDEVQDLTMSQIALFRYICRNVEEGFVFSGDTAQTIARGNDFRFQDIRSLFHKKFVLESRRNEHDGRKEKGQLLPIFNLRQNFRTHVGVLKLSQSIIELLYRFFPQSIEVLEPETGLTYGEPPVLLESGNDENAIRTIFGNSRNVGFGAEQVILVRDDCARKEISNYVGKQALVLTIVECTGLEFQDVLLYNFFSTSPLKNQWRVIYGYMKEQDLMDTTSQMSFPSFSEAKHNVLCSELKQLYVAITCTRQRLWICENIEEISEPMFDYWKKKCLVQVRQLDDSLAQAMQIGSSPEKWRSRGIKLFSENNYEMATMCFERTGDIYWERRSKAASLKATADCLRVLNPEEANVKLREAAEIFEAIGKADSAAQCFSELGEYEQAATKEQRSSEEGEPEMETSKSDKALASQKARARRHRRQRKKKTTGSASVSQNEETTVPTSPTSTASAPMATSTVAASLQEGINELLTPQSVDKSNPATPKFSDRLKSTRKISLADMDAFFQSLSSSTPTPTKAQIEEALDQIKEALNSPPADYHQLGSTSPIKKALQVLASLDESYGFTMSQIAELLSLNEKFKDLPARANKAAKEKNIVVQKEFIKLTLDHNLKSFAAQFTKKKNVTVQTEQEINELLAKLEAAQQRKEALETKMGEIYEKSLSTKGELDKIVEEWPKYEERAKAAEDEENAVTQEWSKIKDLIISVSQSLK